MWVHWASLSLVIEVMWSSSPVSVTVSLGNVLKQGNLEDKLPRELGKGWDPDPHWAEGAPASCRDATQPQAASAGTRL